MLRAETLRDTIAAVALVRPGPSGSGMKAAYVRRRRGMEPVRHLHPLVAPLLEESFGIMLYQEDVLRVAHVMAGFSTEQADHLRRVISKGRGPEALRAVQGRFLAGAVSRGMSHAEAQSLWTLVTNFAAYSFCKAHAATYGQLAYQALYLKARFPAEFFASVLSNGGGFYGPSVYLEEARRVGVRILPPHVNESAREWLGRDGVLRPGLRELRYLSEGSLDAILAEREKGGPFNGLQDFLGRLPALSGRETDSLISVGAFDFTDRPRPELLLARRAAGRPPRDTSQTELFQPSLPSVPKLPAYTPAQRLAAEHHALDVYLSDAPLTPLPLEQRRGARTASELPDRIGEHVRLIGRLIATRRVQTSTGQVMRFCTLEDETGIFEAVLFPEAYRRVGPVLRHAGAYRVEGRVESELGAVTVHVRSLAPLITAAGDR
jgi:DNA polymerase III alpha subunit